MPVLKKVPASWVGYGQNSASRTALGLGLGVRVSASFQISALKVYSNELFLFQLTNDLCTSFTKIVIILFLSKAVFIKRTLLLQYFVLKIEPP